MKNRSSHLKTLRSLHGAEGTVDTKVLKQKGFGVFQEQNKVPGGPCVTMRGRWGPGRVLLALVTV